MKKRPTWILPVIIITQFAGGSLWFSGNAILVDLMSEWAISNHALGYITSAVQFGFIVGTLLFSWFTVSDRYSPRKIFFICSCCGAIANSLIVVIPAGLLPLLLLRFSTGFFLAGIYPVGMKIAAGWFRDGLGRALGYLVGALVLGTAFPHVLKAVEYQLAWKAVLIVTSLLALTGGATMLALVPDGPHLKNGTAFNTQAIFKLFRTPDLKAAAFGYFGHMWELYTLWAFLPVFFAAYITRNTEAVLNIPLWTFIVIACGAVGCVVGGLVSQKSGSARVAFFQLAVSGLCCLLSPLILHLPLFFFLTVMIIWGVTVAGDSPQYSTVIARTAPKDLVGSALTLVNSIGFLLTIISIQLLDFMSVWLGVDKLFLLLLPGPLLGLYSMRYLVCEMQGENDHL